MSKWHKKQLKELTISYSGGTPNRSRPEYFGGEIPWISSGEVNQSSILNTKENISDLGLENSSARWIPKNSVLIAMYGATAGQVSKNLRRATSNQAVLALIPKDSTISTDYIYYQLKFNKEKILFYAQGSGQPNLSKDLIDNFFIDIPDSFQVQSKIAQILSNCDSVIEKTKAAIAKYKAIKQGMLQDLFTRGIDMKTGKLRPSYEDAPGLYKESKLGWIPKEWESATISKLIESNLLEIQDGNHGEIHPKSSDFVKDGIPFIMASDISKDRIDFDNCSRISQEQYNSLRIGFSKSGDILLSHKASIGFVARVPEDFLEVMLTPQVTYYRILNNLILLSGYFEQFLRSEKFQVPLHNLAKQSTRDYIGITMQKTLNVIYPTNIEEQKSITTKLDLIQLKLFSEEKYLKKLQKIKSGMMSDLLSGKKPVKV